MFDYRLFYPQLDARSTRARPRRPLLGHEEKRVYRLRPIAASSGPRAPLVMVHDVIATCPVCTDELTITRLHCRSCGTALEGEFGVGRFGRLDREQMSLLESFLRSRGNLKEMERELGISYPTVRGRVDALVRALGLSEGSRTPMTTSVPTLQTDSPSDRWPMPQIPPPSDERSWSAWRARRSAPRRPPPRFAPWSRLLMATFVRTQEVEHAIGERVASPCA